MPGQWDSSMKQLFTTHPDHFIAWLLEGATYLGELSTHLNRGIDMDMIHEALLNGDRIGVNVEIQRRTEADVAERLWEYNVFASRKFKRPIASFVIYLKKDGKVAESPFIQKLPNGQEIHRFYFTVIKLWEVPTETLRKLGFIGLLPLLPLTREGGTHEVVEEVVNDIRHRVENEREQANLLSIALLLATLAFDNQEDRSWLIRRFKMLQDILHDSEIYQLIMQEGAEKEHLQRLQDLRQILMSLIQPRFPKLVRFATKQVSLITDIKTLKDLIPRIGLAQTEEEAHQLLADLDKIH